MQTLKEALSLTAADAAQQLRTSPQLPLYVQQLNALLDAEREKRAHFYEEMTEDEKVEFINGEVIVHSPVRLRHTATSRRLLTMLDVYVHKHHLGILGYEKTLITLTRNDYEPDIVYFGPQKAQELTPDQTKFPAPDFVVEVLSPSTEDTDRGIKFLDYAAHGIKEYWIIDPDDEFIEQYTLEGEAYTLRMKSKTGTLQSVAIKGFTIPVRAIFDEAEKLATVQQLIA